MKLGPALRFPTLLAAAFVALLPQTASAQAPSTPQVRELAQGPTTAEIQEAEGRFLEGRTLFTQGRFGDALVKFQQACAMRRTANCFKNLGLTEYQMGRYADASTHLREFLKSGSGQGDITEEMLAKLKGMYETSFARSGHVEVTAPPRARIVVEGKEIGDAPLSDPIDLSLGDHVVEAHFGPHVLKENVRLVQGQTAKVTFVDPDAHRREEAPPMRPDRPGHSSARTITLVSLYGVALVGVGLGIGLTLHGEARSNDADAIRNRSSLGDNGCNGVSSADCNELHSLRDTYDKDRMWATIGFATGAGLAALATTLFFVWPNTTKNEPATPQTATPGGRFMPLISPSTAGLGYVGRF
ncbi:tetratricopeptide repeat protein [Pendulispora brunnea]|uniref:Tetratricopeptide repeat protein n=1 Tax=Pendulispora brunnea TaxID=2905690 RepID=A0ABZ2KND3_9BACT